MTLVAKEIMVRGKGVCWGKTEDLGPEWSYDPRRRNVATLLGEGRKSVRTESNEVEGDCQSCGIEGAG